MIPLSRLFFPVQALVQVCALSLALAVPAWGQTPQRVVSLSPALTEAVCELKQCHRLVGVDQHSNWPEQVRRLPQVGSGLNPHLEAVLQLKPDLVLSAKSSRALGPMRSLSLPLLSFEPQTLEDINTMMLALDHHFGAGVWPQWRRSTDERLSSLAQRASMLPPVRAYIEVGVGFGASEASFVGQLWRQLGGENILPAQLGSFPQVNSEYLLREQPQLIVIAALDAEAFNRRPGLNQLKAVRQGHICRLSQPEMDLISRAGPRLAAAAEVLMRCRQKKR